MHGAIEVRPGFVTWETELVSDDSPSLKRFELAQAPVFEAVISELREGMKRTHWMWFVFPQLQALGRSSTARLYGLAGADEALAYWKHPLLGARLHHCVELVAANSHRTAHEIFGSPDDLKFRSCLTLFERVVPEQTSFSQAIAAFFDDQRDSRTIELLDAGRKTGSV